MSESKSRETYTQHIALIGYTDVFLFQGKFFLDRHIIPFYYKIISFSYTLDKS
jgi:hypothetical protein